MIDPEATLPPGAIRAARVGIPVVVKIETANPIGFGARVVQVGEDFDEARGPAFLVVTGSNAERL